MKLRKWCFYRLSDGTFTGRYFAAATDRDLASNIPPGCGAMEYSTDIHARRVDLATGKLVAYTPPPPSADHEWDAAAKRWVLGSTAMQRANIKAQIAELESRQPRALREFALGMDGASDRLSELDRTIAELRKQL